MSTQSMSIMPDELVEIERVGGSLQVQGAQGDSLQAAGDQLRLERRSGSVAVSCAGNLKLSIPRGARLSVGAVSGEARLENLTGSVELGLVGGDAVLLNLSGQVRLPGRIGGDVIAENVARLSISRGGLPGAFDVSERVRRKVEQATRRAEDRARRPRPHVLFGREPGARAAAPEPAGEPASDEERMTVLKMLQEKKITSEEADKLLAALEGNG